MKTALRVLILAFLAVPLALASTPQVSHAAPTPPIVTVTLSGSSGTCPTLSAAYAWNGLHGGGGKVTAVVGFSNGTSIVAQVFSGQNAASGSLSTTLNVGTGTWQAFGRLETAGGHVIKNSFVTSFDTVTCGAP